MVVTSDCKVMREATAAELDAASLHFKRGELARSVSI